MEDKKKNIECTQTGPFEFEVSSDDLKELDLGAVNALIKEILNVVKKQTMSEQVPEAVARLVKAMHTEIIVARCTIIFELVIIILMKFGG